MGRAEDAFDGYDTANLVEAIRNGVTAIYVSPGNSAGTLHSPTYSSPDFLAK